MKRSLLWTKTPEVEAENARMAEARRKLAIASPSRGVGMTCGDCPFFSPDVDLFTRSPHDRGFSDIDSAHRRRTHVRRAICERAKQYVPNRYGPGAGSALHCARLRGGISWSPRGVPVLRRPKQARPAVPAAT